MNLVDSSGWLEYFSDGKNADSFSVPIHEITDLIVPSISIYEVFKVDGLVKSGFITKMSDLHYLVKY